MQIRTTYSAVSNLAYSLREDYRMILARADDLGEKINKMKYEVSSDESALSGQQAKAGQIEMSAEQKAYIAKQKADMAMAEVEYYENEMKYYYDNPDVTVTTDENGNTHTETSVDYAAIDAARSRRDEAMKEYDMHRRDYEEAEAVRAKAEALRIKIEKLHQAVSLVREEIENNEFEFDKNRGSFGNEAEYNMACFVALLEPLGAYVTSRPFRLTTGLAVEGTREATGAPSWDPGTSGASRGEFTVSIPSPTDHPATGATHGTAQSRDRAENEKPYPYKLCDPKFCVHCTAADRAYIAGYASALFDEFFKDGERTEATLLRAYKELEAACEQLFSNRAKPNSRMMCAIRVTFMQLVLEKTNIRPTEEKRLRLLSGR